MHKFYLSDLNCQLANDRVRKSINPKRSILYIPIGAQSEKAAHAAFERTSEILGLASTRRVYVSARKLKEGVLENRYSQVILEGENPFATDGNRVSTPEQMEAVHDFMWSGGIVGDGNSLVVCINAGAAIMGQTLMTHLAYVAQTGLPITSTTMSTRGRAGMNQGSEVVPLVGDLGRLHPIMSGVGPHIILRAGEGMELSGPDGSIVFGNPERIIPARRYPVSEEIESL